MVQQVHIQPIMTVSSSTISRPTTAPRPIEVALSSLDSVWIIDVLSGLTSQLIDVGLSLNSLKCVSLSHCIMSTPFISHDLPSVVYINLALPSVMSVQLLLVSTELWSACNNWNYAHSLLLCIHTYRVRYEIPAIVVELHTSISSINFIASCMLLLDLVRFLCTAAWKNVL